LAGRAVKEREGVTWAEEEEEARAGVHCPEETAAKVNKED
jgi:hypothetical protein